MRRLAKAGVRLVSITQELGDDPMSNTSLKSASRLAKGLTAAGVGIASTAIIGLYWN